MDFDPGIDDSMAIFYAVRRPGIKLEALTTTFGNTDTAISTENALRVLELLGCPDIPVAKAFRARSLIHMSAEPITSTGAMESGALSFRRRRTRRPTSTLAT
jgi:inosine-uridine nucleoside N-ribohydrolase